MQRRCGTRAALSGLRAASEMEGPWSMESRVRFWLVLLTICSIGVAGCGRRSGTARVSGRVTFKDGTVPQGAVCVVRFQPASDSSAAIRKAASADIQKDGLFEAYTRNPGDGVFIGKYDVTFSVLQDVTSSASSLIDPKYTKAKTTPYHVTVDGNVDDLKFELEPIAAAPKKK